MKLDLKKLPKEIATELARQLRIGEVIDVTFDDLRVGTLSPTTLKPVLARKGTDHIHFRRDTLEEAVQEHDVALTYYGKPKMVVVSLDTYKQLTGRQLDE